MTDPGISSRDLLLLVISECHKRREYGRTVLQKVAFFLGDRMGLDLGYRAHYFGPYSDHVLDEVEALVLSGLVEQSVVNFGVNRSGFAVQRYDYSLTDEGQERVRAIQRTRPEAARAVAEQVETLGNALGSLDQRTLSVAAKILFIAREENRPLNSDETREIAHQLGWEISSDEVERMTRSLESLGVIRRK